MDIHKHHLLERLSLPPCIASTLWSRSAGCISKVCCGRTVLYRGSLSICHHHTIVLTRCHSRSPSQALLLLLAHSATCRLFSTHFRTEPVHCKISCWDFGWDCVEGTDKLAESSPWQTQPLCPSSWNNCFLRSLGFFSPKFCVFSLYLVCILLSLCWSVWFCRY